MEFVPKWLALEITGKCNLNCVHCRSASSMSSFESVFDTEGAKALIDDITSFCSPVLVLSGGEPLLRKDIVEIVRAMRARDDVAVFVLTTNVQNMTEKK